MFPDTTPAITTADEVLRGLEGVREQMRLADRGLVVLAVEWAKHNPSRRSVMPMLKASYGPYDYQEIFDEIAFQGGTSFDDGAVTDFAIAAGLTERAARKLIRESIMLVHFLPRVWSRVLAGNLDVWRARNLAGDCFGLSPQAVRFVDTHMSASTARITPSTRESIIARARQEFMPESEDSARTEAEGSRTVNIHTHEADHGVVPVQAVLDLPDALALEAALTVGAQALADAGSTAPLPTRRAWALGDLVRAASGLGHLDLSPDGAGGAPCTCTCHARSCPSAHGLEAPPDQRPHWNGKGASPPGVKLYIHLPSEALGPPPDPDSAPTSRTVPRTARVQGTGIAGEHITTAEVIREWFTRPTLAGAFMPRLSIRRTLDRSEEIHTEAYNVPDSSRDHVLLTHSTCAFPFCTAQVHACDTDHTIPWKPEGRGGATCTCNLAPLCRTHHRLKTHGDNAPNDGGEHNHWAYTDLGAGTYYWKGPRSWAFITTGAGTYDASTGLEGGAPPHPATTPSWKQRLTAALGEPSREETTASLITTLLTKAALTRGQAAPTRPVWIVPDQPEWEPPPAEWDEDGNHIGPSTYFTIPTSAFPISA